MKGLGESLLALRCSGFVLLMVVSSGACGSESAADRPRNWSYIHPAIVAPSCATSSCHSSLTSTAGVELDDATTAYETLVDLQFVMPGNPDSPLLFLLEGDERPLMPPDGPLPEADIELIRAWIEEGAPR